MLHVKAKEELGDLDLNSFSLKDEELEPMFLDYQRRAIDARREARYSGLCKTTSTILFRIQIVSIQGRGCLDYSRVLNNRFLQAWICILDNAGFDAIGPELEFEASTGWGRCWPL